MNPRITFTCISILLLICTKTTDLNETTPIQKFKSVYEEFVPEMEERWVCESVNNAVCEPDPEIICCEHCTCDFTCNMTEGLCCDGSGSTTFRNMTISRNYCHSAEFLTVDDAELTNEKYFFISSCNPLETNQTLIDLCVATSLVPNSENFFQTLPVTSESGISFRNKYCALCNDVSRFTYWDAEIKCKDKLLNGKTLTEIIEQVRNSDQKCNILFSNPVPEIKVSKCGFVNTCKKIKYSVPRTCEPVTTVYRFSENGFENKQCFTCSRKTITCSIKIIESTGFSALLDFNPEDENTNKEPLIYSDICGTDEVYDKIMGTCLDITCIPPLILSNFCCINMYKVIKKMQYEILIKVLVQKPENVPITCSTCVQELVSSITKIYLSIASNFELKTIRCNYNFFLKVNQSEQISMENKSISFVLIHERFSILDKHNYIDFVSDLVSSIPDEVNITIQEERVSLNCILENRLYPQEVVLGYEYFIDPDDGQPLLNFPTKYINNDEQCFTSSSQWNLIHKLKICPHVNINKLLFKSVHLKHNLCFGDVSLCISRDRYIDNGDSISICYEDYLRFYGLYDALVFNKTEVVTDVVEGILSLTCTVLSIISLLFVLFTYFIFPSLRTLPGLNNMALCVSMFLAHLLYQFGIKQTQLGTGCIALGILTHFTWVLTIVWQTICCLHVFRVFVTQTDITYSRSSRYKLFLFYIILSFVVSSAVVSSNIIVKMVSSDQKDIGYGRNLCYINDSFMLALTFALPLGLSVVTNIVLIVIVSIRVCRMPDLQKNVKNERNNLTIFAKLSTLTGVTWILGFIYEWTNIRVLLYIFVILTPLQGVFIMISFVCNRRVFDLYNSLIFDKKKKNQSSRSTVKSSVHSNDVSLSTVNPD